MIRLKESDLLQCCGSTAWAKQVAGHSFPNVKEVFATGDSVWWSLAPQDWREAFGAHTRIGEKAVPREEQPSGHHASEATLAELRRVSHEYEERFGYIFIVCPNGRAVHSILDELRTRMNNDLDTEIKVAAEQQLQITHLRLKRLLAPYK